MAELQALKYICHAFYLLTNAFYGIKLNTDTKKRHPPAKKNGAPGTLVTSGHKTIMTHSIYTTQQLEKLKLGEVKAIALQLALKPQGDRRNKNVWADAIIAHQSSKVQKLSVYRSQIDVEMDKDACIVDGAIAATITIDEDLTQPWVVKINNIEVHRANTWARCYDYVRSHIKYGTLPNPQPDNTVVQAGQEVLLPEVGESCFVGDRLLRCIQVGNDSEALASPRASYAVVWDVVDQGVPMGEISMNWDCFWMHNLSLGTFATPQEAVADLCESASALVVKPKPELEVFTTNDPNVFVVHSRDSGKRYEVCPDSNFCSCPHWLYRHEQEGFEDKHIKAVNVALRSGVKLLVDIEAPVVGGKIL